VAKLRTDLDPSASSGSDDLSSRRRGSTHAMFACAVSLAVISALSFGQPSGDAGASGKNAPPRLSAFSASIGRVHEEGGGTKDGGVKGTYRLCDDGPQSGPSRFGVMSIIHRSGNTLLVRERYPSPSWDIYFGKPECRSKIFWSSTIPADLPAIRESPCYSVALRVRDPAGRWSNIVSRMVNKCPRR
jgi:hypothetical protein